MESECNGLEMNEFSCIRVQFKKETTFHSIQFQYALSFDTQKQNQHITKRELE